MYVCVCRHAFSFPLTFLTDCKIDVNNNNPAGLEHCKLMASVVQYLVTEGTICDNVKQYTVFVINYTHSFDWIDMNVFLSRTCFVFFACMG